MPKILVVDDDVDILFSVELILKKRKLEITALSNCILAIDTATQNEHDLILLDVNLGACDGRDICHQLKIKHNISTPVLLFSANGEYASSFDEFKADGFIQKPFTSSEFVDIIFKHLNFIESVNRPE